MMTDVSRGDSAQNPRTRTCANTFSESNWDVGKLPSPDHALAAYAAYDAYFGARHSPRDRSCSAGARWRAAVIHRPLRRTSAVPTIGLPPSLLPSTIFQSIAGCEDRRRDAP